MVTQPRAGVHYPRSTGEFQSWFSSDADCLDYLAWLRWPEGFVCSRCGSPSGWIVADGSYKCARCLRQTAVTLFDRRRTPLTVWFAACWMFVSQKDAVSALGLQHALEIGSYLTAWAMLLRLRSVLVRPGRDRLTGTVEADETWFGGEEPGLRGRAKGKKSLVAIAVERKEPHGYGRCRMAVVEDASAESLQRFVTDCIEPGANVVTDGWPSYLSITGLGYIREPHSQRAAAASGEDVGALLPGVHLVASLAKRWVLGNHQGSAGDAHLQSYLDEFVFRFNRRTARSRGLLFYRVLELAVNHDPVRYRQLVADSKSKKVPPIPPWRRGHPPTLDRPREDRPWRTAR